MADKHRNKLTKDFNSRKGQNRFSLNFRIWKLDFSFLIWAPLAAFERSRDFFSCTTTDCLQCTNKISVVQRLSLLRLSVLWFLVNSQNYLFVRWFPCNVLCVRQCFRFCFIISGANGSQKESPDQMILKEAPKVHDWDKQTQQDDGNAGESEGQSQVR